MATRCYLILVLIVCLKFDAVLSTINRSIGGNQTSTSTDKNGVNITNGIVNDTLSKGRRNMYFKDDFDVKDGKGFLEPYWELGHTIFLRSTSVTRPPRVFSPIPYSCYSICHNLYKDFGPVCGKRDEFYKKWVYQYKNFNDMCELETENCKQLGEVPMWYPIHRGNCNYTASTFFKDPATDENKLVSLVSFWLRTVTKATTKHWVRTTERNWQLDFKQKVAEFKKING